MPVNIHNELEQIITKLWLMPNDTTPKRKTQLEYWAVDKIRRKLNHRLGYMFRGNEILELYKTYLSQCHENHEPYDYANFILHGAKTLTSMRSVDNGI